MNRRGLLLGFLATPFIIRTPGLLMSVKPFDFDEFNTAAELEDMLLQARKRAVTQIRLKEYVGIEGPDGISFRGGFQKLAELRGHA
jgi:hypothetical protein